ncbi:uncharacterized protein LOC124925310 [Impatiens glandulifera]|uniref:uncharacterized protein LOC124925310 n=1 Tax=Impatiens glandulifera TaxID=253017 RepID=UPI001FB187DF|nr:uncharacterized protein LOC124925310 [Impatiens glandulifera]
MMPPAAPTEQILTESLSVVSFPSSTIEETYIVDARRFSNLRGVRWRIDLGILSCSLSASIDDLRRTTAESRRRYAGLRRRLLIEPHIPKDGTNSPEPVIDNPLSQNPDSMWGRFFKNAELERILDQDLSRLYPEQANYFQTAGCQSMLRRILLLWCLRHPECGYRQGMHELLAPLLYVLQADLENLGQVRKLYEDHFIDKFDSFSFQDSDLMYNFDYKKLSEYMEDEIESKKAPKKKICSLDELDPKIQEIVLISDAYGAEGELGVVISEKFLEHDAYCMFDALMSGSTGAVMMVNFFVPSPLPSSQTGLAPVIEASSAWYHLLSIVDSSLYSHLVELGVEPQYFALRWLRVLFGREFSLDNLLIIWDHIFAYDNCKTRSVVDDNSNICEALNSPRGAFISSLAVSMILYLRSSLLATENPTSCLKRLLNFPNDVSLGKLMGKAKSLLVLALDPNNLTPLQPSIIGTTSNRSRSATVRGHSLSTDSVSPTSPLCLVPDSYWEEKWRIMQKEEEEKRKNCSSEKKHVPYQKKGWSEKVKMRLSRTISSASSSKIEPIRSFRKSLLDDLSRNLGTNDHSVPASIEEDKTENKERDLNGNGNGVSEEGSSSFSDLPSPNNNENDSRRSSSASNIPSNKIDDESNNVQLLTGQDSPLPVSRPSNVISSQPGLGKDSNLVEDLSLVETENPVPCPKEQRLLSIGKFPWLWKFGRRVEGTATHEKAANESTKISSGSCNDQKGGGRVSPQLDVSNTSLATSNGEVVDQNMISTLRNLASSMLENIQVIESSMEQENMSKNIISGRGGQVTAVVALKELRKISNILSEM